MPTWVTWVLLGLLAWFAVSLIAGLLVGRILSLGSRTGPDAVVPETFVPGPAAEDEFDDRRRVLVVDDDPDLRLLLRTTLPASEFDVEEAESAESAAELARFRRPGFAIVDVGLPGANGLSLSRKLKTAEPPPYVILLTGADLTAEERRSAGADAFLKKPFSPIELVTLLDRAGDEAVLSISEPPEARGEQLMIYARDLSSVLERERRQRRLLEHAYRQTVTALADALETKDRSTGMHGERVQRYGLELAAAVDPGLLTDVSLEYGFLLHDVGKIGISETILRKPGPLTAAERRRMQEHPLLGARILKGIPLLEGVGLDVVRAHHERWDGTGYPYGLRGAEIPLAARVFALADALDAITSDRPYRRRLPWDAAVDEILANTGTQFDPRVVAAFAARESRLHRLSEQLRDRAA